MKLSVFEFKSRLKERPEADREFHHMLDTDNKANKVKDLEAESTWDNVEET